MAREQLFHHLRDDAPHPLDGVEIVVAGGAGDGLVRRVRGRGAEAPLTGDSDPGTALVRIVAGEALPDRRNADAGMEVDAAVFGRRFVAAFTARGGWSGRRRPVRPFDGRRRFSVAARAERGRRLKRLVSQASSKRNQRGRRPNAYTQLGEACGQSPGPSPCLSP